MLLKTIYRKVLPARLRQAIRRRIVNDGDFSVTYELSDGWPRAQSSSWLSESVTARFKGGLETFDFKLAQQSPEAALASPVVRDNLSLLHQTGLKDAALLDYGCGNGLYRLVLGYDQATARWQYVGADINSEVIEWCRATHAGTRFELIKEGEALPFREGEFDVVLASGVMQCIPDYADTLSELRRVSGSYLLISRLPIWKHNPTRIVRQNVFHSWGRESHFIHVFNRDEVERFFKGSGFSIAERDYGSETFYVPGVAEPVIHNHYLLKRI
jgi:2-polyprenyl-3-methyl-5-hydroxy-6-metoxy-1,4-benzoquinol methylase